MSTHRIFVNDNQTRIATPLKYEHIYTDGYRSYGSWVPNVKIGTYQTVDCYQGGKFIPGELKLRAFRASRKTVLYGIGSIECEFDVPAYPQRLKTTRWAGPIGSAFPGPLPENVSPISIPNNIGALALTKAKAKFHASGEDLGQFFAELPESLRTLKQGIDVITMAIRKARNGGFTWSRAARALKLLKDGRSLKRIPSQLSNAWLTWRYGIRPLYWDALMIADIIQKGYKRSSDVGLLRKSASETWEETRNDFHQGGSSETDYDYMVQVQAKVKSRATIYYQKIGEVSLASDLLRYYGLHPEQIPGLLWELTPLSFTIDWFSNVGSWVAAITPRADCRILGYCISTKTDLRRSRTSVGSSYKGYGPKATVDVSDFSDTWSEETFDRSVGNSVSGLTTLALKPQVFLSIQQQIDLLTLGIQRFLGNQRRH